jgi:hypothetical protein
MIIFFTMQSSAQLIGIDPGTIFAPSDSNVQYVLWDTSMNKLTINNWTILLEDYLFNFRSDSSASVEINYWRVPKIDLELHANTLLTYDLRGYVQQKYYRLYINGVYQSARANESGSINGQYACPYIAVFSIEGEYDINLDGHINYLEVSYIVSNYGLTGERGWISSDINDDGKVNYLEASLIVTHYGE